MMTKLPRLAFCALILIALASCENSINVISPDVTQQNYSWRNQPQTSPVNLSLQFSPRADLTTPGFKIELRDVSANACGANLLRDIRPEAFRSPLRVLGSPSITATSQTSG
jgi:hypothetical protein